MDLEPYLTVTIPLRRVTGSFSHVDQDWSNMTYGVAQGETNLTRTQLDNF
jgi:hypothetical protein